MNRPLKLGYALLIYLLLYCPVIVFVVYSFNDATYSAVWHGATWKWYRTLWQDTDLITVTEHSLLLAFLAATLSTILAALGSAVLYRYRFFGKHFLTAMIMVLIIVPDLVFGVSFLILFASLHIPLGLPTLLIAHITFCLPFVIVTVLARLQTIDRILIDAAKDLGASESRIFFKVILPLMRPALIAGWFLAFSLSMDDVVISFFVSGARFEILPLYIYSKVHVGITPEMNALCSIIFVVTLLGMGVAQLCSLKTPFKKPQ